MSEPNPIPPIRHTESIETRLARVEFLVRELVNLHRHGVAGLKWDPIVEASAAIGRAQKERSHV